MDQRPMHPTEHPVVQLLHWALYGFGNWLLWLGGHMTTILGCASVLFGMFIQWQNYRLNVRRAEREAAQQAGSKS